MPTLMQVYKGPANLSLIDCFVYVGCAVKELYLAYACDVNPNYISLVAN